MCLLKLTDMKIKSVKKILLIFALSALVISCENSIKADYDTIRTKKIILTGDDGKDYQLSVKTDGSGKPSLEITAVK